MAKKKTTEVEIKDSKVEESGSLDEMPEELRKKLNMEAPEEAPEESIAEKVGVSPEMLALMQKVQGYKQPKNEKMLLALRRQVRYRCFRIRDGGKIAEEHDKGLKSFLEKQFKSLHNGEMMTWSNFTFAWDIAPNDPLRVIPNDILNNEWREQGGLFQNDKMYPPAFTRQK